MAAAGFGWTPLDVSHERRAWLRAAATVSFGLTAALASGLAAEPSVSLALAALAALSAAAVSTWWSVRPVTAWALYIGADGTIWGRVESAGIEVAAPARLHPQVVAARMVTLTTGRQVVAVWRDALPPAQFRRLCAHARWHVERAGRPAGLAAAAIDGGN
ncbi:MAG: hypothetical protein U5L03_07110 [Burkholderiaceae bacterium]|nr:hypothetical protein [Burkholderiaceae bacterium]